MWLPRRWLTYASNELAPSSSRIEKFRSQPGQKIPQWVREYQRRIREARAEYLLLKEQGEPEEAEPGQGEVQMRDPSQDLVQDQLSDLAQQIEHVIEACNQEKGILEDEFGSVNDGIHILESR